MHRSLNNEDLFRLVSDNQLEFQTWLFIVNCTLLIKPNLRAGIIDEFSKTYAVKLTRDDPNPAQARDRLAKAIKTGLENNGVHDFELILKDFIAKQATVRAFPYTIVLDLVLTAVMQFEKYNFDPSNSIFKHIKRSSLMNYINLNNVNETVLERSVSLFRRIIQQNYKVECQLTMGVKQFIKKNKLDNLLLWAEKSYEQSIINYKQQYIQNQKNVKTKARLFGVFLPIFISAVAVAAFIYLMWDYLFALGQVGNLYVNIAVVCLTAFVITYAFLYKYHLLKQDLLKASHCNQLRNFYLEIDGNLRELRDSLAKILSINIIEFDNDEVVIETYVEHKNNVTSNNVVPAESIAPTYKTVKRRLLGQQFEETSQSVGQAHNYVDEYREEIDSYYRTLTKNKVETRLLLRKDVQKQMSDTEWLGYYSIFKEGRIGGDRGKCVKFLPRHSKYSAEIKNGSDMRVYATPAKIDGKETHEFKYYEKAMH